MILTILVFLTAIIGAAANFRYVMMDKEAPHKGLKLSYALVCTWVAIIYGLMVFTGYLPERLLMRWMNLLLVSTIAVGGLLSWYKRRNNLP